MKRAKITPVHVIAEHKQKKVSLRAKLDNKLHLLFLLVENRKSGPVVPWPKK